MPPAIRLELAVVAISQQRVVVRIRFQVHAAAVSTVATRRPTARHILLAPERNAPVAAVPGLYENFCFIYKQRQPPTAKSLDVSDVPRPLAGATIALAQKQKGGSADAEPPSENRTLVD